MLWNVGVHYCDRGSPPLVRDAVLTPAPYLRYVFNYLPLMSTCFRCCVLPFDPSDRNPGFVYRSTRDNV